MRIEFFEPQGTLDVDCVLDTARLVGYELRRAPVKMWTRNELLMAYDFFMRLYLRASDNNVRWRPAPSFVTNAQ